MEDSRRARRTWRPGPDTAIALTALVLCAGGVGWAATRDASTQVITACADQAGGTLHLLTSGSCDPASQTQVQWNQQGPQGAQGLAGPQGPPGSTANQAVSAALQTTFPNRFTVFMTI